MLEKARKISFMIICTAFFSPPAFADLPREGSDRRIAPPHRIDSRPREFDCARSFCGCSTPIQISYATTILTEASAPLAGVSLGCAAEESLGITDDAGKVSFLIKTARSPGCGVACKKLILTKETLSSYQSWVVNLDETNGKVAILKQPHQAGELAHGVKSGRWQEWCPNGHLSVTGRYGHGIKQGKWQEWYCNGQPKTDVTYLNGKREGSYAEWYESGQIRSQGLYHADKRNGAWSSWYENGQVESEGEWQDDKRSTSETYHTRDGNKVSIPP